MAARVGISGRGTQHFVIRLQNLLTFLWPPMPSQGRREGLPPDTQEQAGRALLSPSPWQLSGIHVPYIPLPQHY